MIRLQRLDPSPAGDVADESTDDEPQRHLSLRQELAGQGRATRIAWSPDGSLLAVPSRDRTIRIYDATTGVLRAHLHGHVDAVLSACWSPDGRRLASGGYDRQLVLWGPLSQDGARQPVLGEQFADGEVGRLATFVDHARELNTVAWSCTNLLASCAEDGQVIVRDALRDCAIVEILPIADATHCAWSPDGRWLAVGTQAGRVEIWEPLEQEHERTLEPGEDPVVMVAWSSDGTRFACASKEGGLVLWAAGSGWMCHGLRGHSADVVAVSFSADGRLLASKSRDHTVVLWRTDGRWPVALIRAPATPTGWCVGLAFHPRERVLAGAGDEDDVVRLWDLDVALCARGRGVLVEDRAALFERSPLPDAALARVRARRRVALV